MSAPMLASGGLPGRFPGYAPPDLDAIRATYREGTCFLRQGQTIADWPGATACTIPSRPHPQTLGAPSAPERATAEAPPLAARAGARPRRTILLWGDSFAAHLVPAIIALPPRTDAEVVQLTASACPPVVPAAAARSAATCGDVAARALRLVAAGGIDRVILAGRWDRYDTLLSIADVAGTIDTLARLGSEVVVVGRSPVLAVDDPYHWDYLSPGRTIPLAAETALERDIATLATTGESELAAMVAPLDVLCASPDRPPRVAPATCPATIDGRLVFADEGHLTAEGSRLLLARIGERLFGHPAQPPAASGHDHASSAGDPDQVIMGRPAADIAETSRPGRAAPGASDGRTRPIPLDRQSAAFGRL